MMSLSLRKSAAVVVLSVSLAFGSPAAQAKSNIDLIAELMGKVSRVIEKGKPLFAPIWMQDTTDRLNEILDESAQITDELKNLNIGLKQASTEAFTNFLQHTLRADIDQFEISIPELRGYRNQNESSHHQIDLLIHNLERDVFTSLDYGPAAYQTTYAAVMVARALYKYTDASQDRQREFFTKVSNKFSDWLDEKQDGSPAALKKSAKDKITAIEGRVHAIKAENKSCYEVSESDFTARKVSYYKPTCYLSDPTGELATLKEDYKKLNDILKDLETVVSQLRAYRDALKRDRVDFEIR